MSRKVAQYLYLDHRSRPRLRKVRKFPKQFFMDSWDVERGRWVPRIDAQREFSERAMFQLPEMLWALSANHTAAWCEGEKDAGAVSAALGPEGGVGTSHWQGACNATPEQAEWFNRGRGPILLVADVDDAGAACVLIRHKLLMEAKVSPSRVTIIAPPRPHKDAAEALQAGVRLDEFREPSRGRLKVAAARYAEQRASGGGRGDSDWYGPDKQLLSPFAGATS